MLKKRFLPQVHASNIAPLQMGEAGYSTLGPVINCLVWNIWKARSRGWLEEFARLNANKDLVLLQEAVSNAPSDSFFANDKRAQWIMARSHAHPRTSVETGVKTGCVVKASSVSAYASPCTEPIVKTPKMLLSTTYPLSNAGDLMVLNMHAINFVTNKSYVSHLDQLGEALMHHAGPVILAGDFNTWSLKRHGCFTDIAKQSGLLEATMQRRQKLRHLNSHLDHVFYRGLRLRDVKSLEHIKLSDHAPIVATFELESN